MDSTNASGIKPFENARARIKSGPAYPESPVYDAIETASLVSIRAA